ncbi:DNA primase large subunit-like [Sitophilus oryzae]|uniref:DNA primase large subunit n=1 Tax=Sitophilus oryzae TaxID=7048 RepID=A0A6J2XZ93_SITOR|nr:DNA primase large subunit-like [Sitophilus oryzae]
MDINARRRRNHTAVVHTDTGIYSHDLSLYSEYPTNLLGLSEFEELALERLQLLRIIEQASLKGHKLFSNDWKNCIKEDLIKNTLKKYARLMNGANGQTELDIQARRADHISHYILRLAYCRSEDLRRWFLAREMDWFRIKFTSQTSAGVLKFLDISNLRYTPISNEEKDEIKGHLLDSTPGLSHAVISTDFYKVPIHDVLLLVKGRRSYLKAGFAYIPMSDLVVCIQSKFRASLSESLNYMSHRIANLDDERLSDLLCNLHNTYTGKDYVTGQNKDAVNIACLDEYSKKHFPLCMRHMHEVLTSTHHLKHNGRLQYGLFLKGIGVLYESANEFWRREFTKAMDSDKFEKKYSYNFKHQYGLVGNRVDYSPYSCIKIIMSNVGPGETHGCPFKHWDNAYLKSKLNEYGVDQEGVKEIMTLVSNKHYQIACTKYFELTHGQQQAANSIIHPNQYFEESMNLTKDRAEKAKK